MWEKSYKNTSSIVLYKPYKHYVKVCKSCGKFTETKPTREMQTIGNCRQRITLCNCGLTFIEDLN